MFRSRFRFIALFSVFGYNLFGSNTQNNYSYSDSLRTKLVQSQLLFHEGNISDAIQLMNEVLDEYRSNEPLQSIGEVKYDENNEALSSQVSIENNERRSAFVECLFARGSYHLQKFEIRAALDNFRAAKQYIMEQQDAITDHLKIHPEDRNSLHEMHNYWKSWRHLIDGSILLIMPGRGADAEKQFQLAATTISNSTPNVIRKIAHLNCNYGNFKVSESYINQIKDINEKNGTSQASKSKWNPKITQIQINEENYKDIDAQISHAHVLNMLSIIYFNTGDLEKSYKNADESLKVIEKSFFGIMSKVRYLFIKEKFLEAIEIIDLFGNSLRDIESISKVYGLKYFSTDKFNIKEGELEFQKKFGNYFNPRIEALNIEFEKCNNLATMVDPDTGLPVYPAILEILIRRSQYKLALLNLKGYLEDETMAKQVYSQILTALKSNVEQI